LRQKLYPRLLGACGRGVVIGRNVTLRHPQRIALGDGVIIDDGCVLDAKGEDDRTIELGPGSILGRNTILSCKGGRIVLDRDVNISVNCTLISETSLHIGEKTLLAGHCYLIAGGNHGLERTDVAPVDQPYYEKGGIDIARHGWLGAGVRVLDGVRMGQGAVAAAGAVVHQSVPEFAIVGGVPAKVIRNRKAATGDSGSPDRDPQGED
ncbi:MAG: acyltransferase, partial [Phycisphaeraceae bacterium]